MPASPRFLPVVPAPGPDESVPREPPVFERIAILGIGLIGGSIALAARKAWPAALVIGVDRHEVLERAMVRHAVDVASTDPMIISAADLVVLATPVPEIVRLVAELPSQLAGEAVVTDVGSTKRQVVAAAAPLPAHLTFIGGHPLAGVPEAGFEHARADLFTGCPWLLTPPPAGGERSAQALQKVSSFVAGLGALPVTVPSADAHDDMVAAMERLIAELESLRPGLASAATIERLFAAARERRGHASPGA